MKYPKISSAHKGVRKWSSMKNVEIIRNTTDYATCTLDPVKNAKLVFGDRLTMIKDKSGAILQFRLDGKPILIGDLIRKSKENQ